MRTPAQALRDAIASGAVEAWNRGGRIEIDRIDLKDGFSTWIDDLGRAPCFENPGYIWRPAPTKRRIPFTFGTAPTDAWWRAKSDHYSNYMAIKICGSGILFPDRDGHATGYDIIAKEWEMSEDRVNWKPASLEVES